MDQRRTAACEQACAPVSRTHDARTRARRLGALVAATTAAFLGTVRPVVASPAENVFGAPSQLVDTLLVSSGGGPSLLVLLAVVVLWVLALWRFWSRRSWLLFYGTGALGTVLLTIVLFQNLGLDAWLASVEARQVAWIAGMMDLNIEQVSASGLAIQNHVGWGVFDIGIECSALLELSAFAGLALFYPTFSVGRKAWILVVGLAATYLINIVRILLIVSMISSLGTSWVFVAHAVIGRVFFFAGVVIVFWLLMTGPTLGVMRSRLEGAVDV